MFTYRGESAAGVAGVRDPLLSVSNVVFFVTVVTGTCSEGLGNKATFVFFLKLGRFLVREATGFVNVDGRASGFFASVLLAGRGFDMIQYKQSRGAERLAYL